MSNKENKIKMKEIKATAKLKQEMLDHPDLCYCFETLDKAPNCDYDSPIGYTEKIVDNYLDGTQFTFRLPIFKCKRCGKKHIVSIVKA